MVAGRVQEHLLGVQEWTGVRVHLGGPGIVLVTCRGRLDVVAGPAASAVLSALASDGDLVVCDLTGATGDGSRDAVDTLVAAAAPMRHWAGTFLVFVCPTERFRDEMALRVEGNVLVTVDGAAVQAAMGEGPRAVAVARRLAPSSRSSATARDLVLQACSEWGCFGQRDAARLVAAELVTNAVVHARTTMSFRIAYCESRLRLSVRDGSGRAPRRQAPATEQLTGRGLILVSALSESWGVLPHWGGGKVTWAVMSAQVTAAKDMISLR